MTICRLTRMELPSFVRKNAFSDYFTPIKNHKFFQIYAETSFVVGVASIPLLEFSLSSSSHSLISTGFSLLRASSAFLASIFANWKKNICLEIKSCVLLQYAKWILNRIEHIFNGTFAVSKSLYQGFRTFLAAGRSPRQL